MSVLNRRSFFTIATTLVTSACAGRNKDHLWDHLRAPRGGGGYGSLYPTRSANTDELLLALPEGFQYTVIGKEGTRMADGNVTPRAHDAMAAFSDGGAIRLVRNHEINNGKGRAGVAIGGDAPAYDHSAGGGTTTLIVDPSSGEIVRDFVSLSGSLHNCAGGPTPWGTWITCEETVFGTRAIIDKERGIHRGEFEKEHGYCFEVPALADGPVEPVPLKEMGRFVHEAVAVDPATGIVYETEDRNPCGFYRYVPEQPGKLAAGGRLEMLAVMNQPRYDTRTGQSVGISLPAVWVDIADPDPAAAGIDSLAVYRQGAEKGGAAFSRLEGCWYGKGSIFFIATSGGNEKIGQIWEYRPAPDGDGVVKLVFESPTPDLLEGPDNLCVSPRGGLVLCEDGPKEQYLRGLTPEGRIFDLAQDITGAEIHGEFAGATFSPDGRILFVNIQRPGMTLAIRGPWHEGAL